MAGIAQIGQLFLGVQSTHLGWEGYIYHSWLDRVLAHAVGKVALVIVTDLLTGDDALMAWNRQNLVTGRLDRTGLMAGDMSVIRCNDALIRTQDGRNRNQIGLCSANQKVYIRISSRALSQ